MASLSKPEITKTPQQADLSAIARATVDCFNKREFDKIATWAAPDSEFVDVPMGLTFRGPEGIQTSMQGWLQAFPDARCEITNVIENGDLVAMEWVGRGTNTGPMINPDGSVIPATGKYCEFTASEVQQFKNGKIVRGRMYYDSATIMRQLGLLPGAPTERNDKPIVRGKDEGKALWMLGGLYEVKATKKETNGELSVIQFTMPHGTGAPPHIHDCGESLYVLEGTLRVHLGEKEVRDLSAGEFVYFPKGTLEWHENVSGKNAKFLVTYTPGGMDEFFVEAAEPAKKREPPPPSNTPPDVARLSEIASRHGLQIKGPK